MSAPNRNTLWAQTLVSELAAAGIEAVCIAPGSRSTPLTVAFAESDAVTCYSHLDERSAAFFALGRAKHTRTPTALVCTSGTAAANFHPAVIEADQSRVPLVLLTADRPPELHDSGANQTVDQTRLYGDAVRMFRTLPEPATDGRTLRSLRVLANRAVGTAIGPNPGPVHLNVPLAKPLEPVEVPGDVPDDLDDRAPLGAAGRNGPYVRTVHGRQTVTATELDVVADALDRAARPLVVAGPDDGGLTPDALADLATATGAPVFADPVSGLRFGPHVADLPICGGYDSFLDAGAVPDPDVVVRFGASPTSKVLRHYLRDADARQFVVDQTGAWPEAEFTATDLIAAAPTWFASALAERVTDAGGDDWREQVIEAERTYWAKLDEVCATLRDEAGATFAFEGEILASVADRTPDGGTLFVSNSMPVRDLDRFGRPRTSPLAARANRGASGIDGITSTALGIASSADGPLVLALGDLAYYHDMNGLLAAGRCAGAGDSLNATVVLVNNDGGGIFHKLPIEDFDPPFTDQFKTPHGLDFEPTGDLYDLAFERVDERGAFEETFDEAVASPGTQVVEVQIDGETSHRRREAVQEKMRSLM
jgi:2-succinyl-5-enolpyruvyl-6-hydroxy-3-cyclohexene-1-carboxylate synthase